jgi:hypothetical protein
MRGQFLVPTLLPHWCPERDSNPHRLPSERSASADWAIGTCQCVLVPAGGIKPPSHPYEGRVLPLNYAGSFVDENFTKFSNGRASCFASPTKRRQLHNAASNFFGRSRCKTARSLRIAFANFRHGSAMPRAHAPAAARMTRIMRAHLMRAARTLSQSRCWFLRLSGPFCPPACLAEGFSALPPVIPVLLTLVRVYSSVGPNRTRTHSANRSVGSPAARRLLVRYVSVSNASGSLFGFEPSRRLVCHN